MSWAERLVRHNRWVLALFAIVAAGLAVYAPRFEINASAETLISEGNRDYIQARLVQQRFASEAFVLVAYEPAGHDLFGAQSIDDLRALTREIGRLETVESVRSLINVPLIPADASVRLSSDVDPDAWLLDNLSPGPRELRKILDGHPIYDGLLVNEAMTATALQVMFRSDPELDELQRRIIDIQSGRLEGRLTDEQLTRLERLREQASPLEKAQRRARSEDIAAMREIADRYRDSANLYLGGAEVLGVDLIRMVRNDLRVFGLAVLGMISLVLLLVFRRIRWVLLPLVCCGVSVIMTLGLFGLLGLKATVISANFIALQLVLTLAVVVHLIVQYREEAEADAGADQRALVTRTLRRKLGPCLYAGLTTSVGFASLILTDIEPVRAFGLMMILAMAVSILTSLILFPATMLMLRRVSGSGDDRWVRGTVNGLSGLSIRRGALVMMAAIATFVLAVAGTLLLDVENSFIDYFDESTRIHEELTFIDREFGGSTPLDVIYHMPGGGPDGGNLVIRAETVQMLQRMQAVMDEQPAMGTVLSLVNFTELARALNGDRPLTETELTAVYWMLDESMRKNLVRSYFSESAGHLRLSARIVDTTEGLDRGDLLQSLRQGFEDQGLTPDDYLITGLFVLYQDLLERLFSSQAMTLGVVFVALALAFALIFRSLRIAVIAVIPNVLSAFVVLGVMGWAGISLDFMTITIAAVAMGIAVDDTIHYVHRFLEERRGGGDAVAAVRASHRSIGAALLYTTLIIVCGFALLGFSDFVPSVLFGLLSALAMLVALITDLTLLPVMLRRFASEARS
ncbi:MMPL family transporter [uncultured Abyssibacter sp.]|uniref:efflux RND transporter permease subunit n=1 Tax=uncultured Abyssibacter sp. TaxID=2320202 RepID=UPI0032B1ADE5